MFSPWDGKVSRSAVTRVIDRVRRFTAQEINLRFYQVMGLLESTRTLKLCQLFACSLFTLLFAWHTYQGDFLTALVYFSGSLVTALLLSVEKHWSKNYHQLLSRYVFTAYTFISLLLLLLSHQQNYYLHLSLNLAYPLLAFSLLPFRVGLFFVLVFSVFANLLLMLHLEGTFRAAYLTTFWLITLLTSLHHFSHYTRQEELKKQLNRDSQTQLLNKRQFLIDLHKEQERAQREATHLGIIYLASEQELDLRTANETASYFAAYESIYSVTPKLLIALIPLANPAELILCEKKLAIKLPKLNITSQIINLDKPAAEYLQPMPQHQGVVI